MNIKNYEFKARVNELQKYENKLLTLNPKYIGLDHQIDTYFNTKCDRLKLREGNIENSLINYERQNIKGSKESKIILYRHKPDKALKNILIKQLGIKVIVNKKRKIYFIDNVKFHFDIVEGLGKFIEVEAIDDSQKHTKYTIEYLKKQCDKYFNFFDFNKADIVSDSYSDLTLKLFQ